MPHLYGDIHSCAHLRRVLAESSAGFRVPHAGGSLKSDQQEPSSALLREVLPTLTSTEGNSSYKNYCTLDAHCLGMRYTEV